MSPAVGFLTMFFQYKAPNVENIMQNSYIKPLAEYAVRLESNLAEKIAQNQEFRDQISQLQPVRIILEDISTVSSFRLSSVQYNLKGPATTECQGTSHAKARGSDHEEGCRECASEGTARAAECRIG